MKIYKKYLFYNLVKPFLLSFFILGGIVWLTRIINYLSYLTEYNADFLLFINLIILVIPNSIPLIIIISAIISIINTYNKLLENNELIILKGTGLSKKKLIEPIIYFGFLLSIICFFILSYLVPYTSKKFESVKDNIFNDVLNTAFKEGDFNNVNNITFYAKERNNNELESVLVSIQDKKEKNIIYAKEATIDGNIINFNNGNINTITNNENNIIYFDKYIFNLNNFYNRRKPNSKSMDLLNINELLNLKVSKNNKKIYMKYLSQIFSKISISVLCFVMSIFSGLLILNKSFSRRSNSYTALISIISIIVFIINIYLIKNSDNNIYSIYMSSLLNILIFLFSTIGVAIKK